MDKQKIIRMAAEIKLAASHVTAAGADNWINLLGIIRTADALILETQKDEGGEADG